MQAEQSAGQIDTGAIQLLVIIYGSDKPTKNIILVYAPCLKFDFLRAFRNVRTYLAIILQNRANFN